MKRVVKFSGDSRVRHTYNALEVNRIKEKYILLVASYVGSNIGAGLGRDNQAEESLVKSELRCRPD